MKTNIPTKTIVVAVAVLLMAMSMAVMADHVPDAKKKHKDDDKGKYTYVGLGIGDHIIQCLPKETPGIDINEVDVTVYDPLSDNPKDGEGDVLVPTDPIKVPGGPIIVPPQDLTGGANICLGGAANTTVYDPADPGPNQDENGQPNLTKLFNADDKGGNWTVWAIDEVYETVKQLSSGAIDIVPSGFATIRIAAVQDSGPNKDICVPEDTWTQVCVGDSGVKSDSKILTQFSFCGKGGVNSINETVWDKLEDKKDDITSYSISKLVFMDGPLFYALDCGLTGSGLVAPSWTTVADTWNSTPGCDPLGVCLVDELPGGDAECWEGTGGTPKGSDPNGNWKARGAHESGIATIGEIGWSHDFDMDCSESGAGGDWITSSPSPAVIIQNFPVQVTVGSSEDKQ